MCFTGEQNPSFLYVDDIQFVKVSDVHWAATAAAAAAAVSVAANTTAMFCHWYFPHNCLLSLSMLLSR